MAKKASSAAKSAAKKSVVPAPVATPAELSSLTEEQLRDRARDDMNAFQKDPEGSDVETVTVTIARSSFIREVGSKVSAGQELVLPVSVVAFYERTQPGMFGGDAEKSDSGHNADGE